MSSQYGELGPVTAEIGSRVWDSPASFNRFRVLASLQQRRRSQGPKALHDIWPSLWLVHCIYIFGGSFPLAELFQVQNSLCVQLSLVFSYGSVTAQHFSSGHVSETLQRRTRNGITELSQTAPPIFGWAAITLGIGPHSSYDLFYTHRNFVTRFGMHMCHAHAHSVCTYESQDIYSPI